MIGRWVQRALYWGAIALVVAGLTHLGTILVLPYRSAGDAYGHMVAATGGAPLKAVMVPSSSLGPDQDPALATAICLYDLGGGPMAVSLDVAGADFAAIAVHDRYGRLLSGLTNRSASQNRLAVTVLTPAQAIHRPAPAEGALAEIKVESNEPTGFVSAQWLVSAPSARGAAEAAVARLSCRTAN